MRVPGGYMVAENVDGSVDERDTFTCAHMNEIVVVRPGEDPANVGAHCKTCDALICKRCASKQECIPFEKWLAYKEGRVSAGQIDAARRQLAEAEFRARRIEVQGVAPPAAAVANLGGPLHALEPSQLMERNILQRRHDAYLAARFGGRR